MTAILELLCSFLSTEIKSSESKCVRFVHANGSETIKCKIYNLMTSSAPNGEHFLQSSFLKYKRDKGFIGIIQYYFVKFTSILRQMSIIKCSNPPLTLTDSILFLKTYNVHLILNDGLVVLRLKTNKCRAVVQDSSQQEDVY